jgi:hypothetical protein
MGAIINFFKSIIGLITGIFSKKPKPATAVAGQPVQTPQVEAPKAAKAPKAEKAPKPAKRQRGKDGFYRDATPADLAPAPAAPTGANIAAPTPANASVPAKKGGVPKQSTKGKVGQAAAAAAVAMATATAAPPPVDAVDLIRAALAATQSTPAEQSAQAEASTSFAEMNAVPYDTGKRRNPGANMTGFLDMAKAIRKR